MTRQIPKWSIFVKSAQAAEYQRKGRLSGALAGGALSALLSAIHYNRGKKKRKDESFGSKFIKSLLWTGLGTFGGGLLGSGIGRMIGNHVQYKRNLEAAKDLIREQGLKKRPGRVMYVNYPGNRYKGDLIKGLEKIFPNGAPIQHGALITMDNDGGNARFFQIGALTGEKGKSWARFLIRNGLDDEDDRSVLSGARALSGKINLGGLFTENLRNALKGKNDEEIARILADYGKKRDLGNVVEIFEGKKNVDRNLPEVFAKIDNKTENCASGYGLLPGRYNCGTSARRMYSTVNDPKDHFLDILWGGFPGANAPSMARKIVGRSYEIENRKDETPKALGGPEMVF